MSVSPLSLPPPPAPLWLNGAGGQGAVQGDGGPCRAQQPLPKCGWEEGDHPGGETSGSWAPGASGSRLPVPEGAGDNSSPLVAPSWPSELSGAPSRNCTGP